MVVLMLQCCVSLSVTCNVAKWCEISDRSILYQKCLSEIHNKLNCVRWEVDTPEKMRNQSWQKNEVENNCCLTNTWSLLETLSQSQSIIN